MSGRLIEAQETERARIARDLHDDIGQRLAVLAMVLEHVKELQPDVSGEALGCLDALQEQTADIIAGSAGAITRLHRPGCCIWVSWPQCEVSGRAVGTENVAIDFRYENVPGSVPPDVSLCLFRVLQEALNNAVRHSRVRHFHVQLRGAEDAVHLTIRDEGVGFDVDAASQGLGLGMTSMRERLKLVGGELLIESQPTCGTTVLARVPVRRS